MAACRLRPTRGWLKNQLESCQCRGNKIGKVHTVPTKVNEAGPAVLGSVVGPGGSSSSSAPAQPQLARCELHRSCQAVLACLVLPPPQANELPAHSLLPPPTPLPSSLGPLAAGDGPLRQRLGAPHPSPPWRRWACHACGLVSTGATVVLVRGDAASAEPGQCYTLAGMGKVLGMRLLACSRTGHTMLRAQQCPPIFAPLPAGIVAARSVDVELVRGGVMAWWGWCRQGRPVGLAHFRAVEAAERRWCR